MAAAPRAGSPEVRATWLVLATDGPGLELGRVAPAATLVRAVADLGAFADLLASDRPRVVILAEPPAGARELGFVREERRRQGLRIIHLSPGSAVSARIAALRDGFDDALPQTIEPGELAARATLLEERTRARPATSLLIARGYELDLVAHELRLDGRSVRSKIEPQPDRPIHLVTVRGVGYRLDPPLTEP